MNRQHVSPDEALRPILDPAVAQGRCTTATVIEALVADLTSRIGALEQLIAGVVDSEDAHAVVQHAERLAGRALDLSVVAFKRMDDISLARNTTERRRTTRAPAGMERGLGPCDCGARATRLFNEGEQHAADFQVPQFTPVCTDCYAYREKE